MTLEQIKILEKPAEQLVAGQYRVQQYICIENNGGEYAKPFPVEVFGNRVDAVQMEVGEVYDMEYDPAGRQSADGRWWFSTPRIWKATPHTPGEAASPVVAQPVAQPAAQPAQVIAPAQTVAQERTELPF